MHSYSGSERVHRLTDFDLRHIRVFRTIVECSGLAGAEIVLNLSQSRVSASLAELEARLGVRLCRRGRSGFALTAAGETVYEASHDLFEAVDRFSNRVSEISDNLRRVLRFGTVDAVATNPGLSLADAFRRLRRLVPAVTIDFLTASPEDLEQQLIAGHRDVLIIPSTNKRAGLSYTPLLTEKQSLYCGKGNPLFDIDDSSITVDTIARHAFVARGYLHQHDLKRVGHQGEEATVEMMESQLILILSGEFIGYLPAHYAESAVRDGRLRPINNEKYSYDSLFYFVTQPDGMKNSLIRKFRSTLEESMVQS